MGVKGKKIRSSQRHLIVLVQRYSTSGFLFWQGLRGELKEHLQNGMEAHLLCLGEQCSNLEKQLKQAEEQRDELKVSLSNISGSYDTLASRLAALESRLPESSSQTAISTAGSAVLARNVQTALDKAEKAEASSLETKQTNEHFSTRLTTLDRQVKAWLEISVI